jgi:hypothetical protein
MFLDGVFQSFNTSRTERERLEKNRTTERERERAGLGTH